MPQKLIDAEGNNYQIARYMATAVNLAYLPAAEGEPAFKEQLGLDATLITANNTEVYVGQTETDIVLAFRGSESPTSIDGLKDWLVTNADNLLVLPEGSIGTDFAAAGVGARFHKGFMGALADIWSSLNSAVNAAYEAKERRVWVTGHSLGGALALLAPWRLQRNFVPIHRVVTFGAPMIGNAAAAAAFEKEFPGKIYRYVDKDDLVTKLPTMSLTANAYGHCPTEVLLGAQAAAAAELVASGAGGAWDAAAVEAVWGQLTSRITHHFMANYLARIAEQCPEDG
jgi:hypothetical protein